MTQRPTKRGRHTQESNPKEMEALLLSRYILVSRKERKYFLTRNYQTRRGGRRNEHECLQVAAMVDHVCLCLLVCFCRGGRSTCTTARRYNGQRFGSCVRMRKQALRNRTYSRQRSRPSFLLSTPMRTKERRMHVPWCIGAIRDHTPLDRYFKTRFLHSSITKQWQCRKRRRLKLSRSRAFRRRMYRFHVCILFVVK